MDGIGPIDPEPVRELVPGRDREAGRPLPGPDLSLDPRDLQVTRDAREVIKIYLRKLSAGPRSPRSTRAPTRSSAWSWRGGCSRADLRARPAVSRTCLGETGRSPAHSAAFACWPPFLGLVVRPVTAVSRIGTPLSRWCTGAAVGVRPAELGEQAQGLPQREVWHIGAADRGGDRA